MKLNNLAGRLDFRASDTHHSHEIFDLEGILEFADTHHSCEFSDLEGIVLRLFLRNSYFQSFSMILV